MYFINKNKKKNEVKLDIHTKINISKKKITKKTGTGTLNIKKMKNYKITKNGIKIGDKTYCQMISIKDWKVTINGITFQIKKSQKGGFIAQNNSYPDSFWVEENSYIDAQIIGKCYIKENSTISKATIINSIIDSNVIIYKSITIKKEIIGDNTEIINI